MTTTVHNLEEHVRGDDGTITVTHTADGDLTGAEIRATWREEPEIIGGAVATGTVVYERANLAAGGSAAEIALLTTTSFAIYRVAANTSGLAISTGQRARLHYDVEIITAAGLRHTVLIGTQYVRADVTT